MGFDKTRWGNDIASRIAAVGVVAGTPVTPAQLQEVWQAIKEGDVAEISTNADINLAVSDMSILPGTFIDSLAAPITGLGANAAVVLAGKLE